MYDFSKKYEKKEFNNFLNDFLPDDAVYINKDLKINESFKYFAKSRLIAEVNSINDLKVIEIKHIGSTNNKIEISKNLFRLLSHFSYSNALVVIYSEEEDNYRFSLITSSLLWIDDKKIKKEFSNPRRLSFLLGPSAKIHTPTTQLIKMGKLKNYEDLNNRFNIEIVNDEFFENYKKLYFYLKKYLDDDKIFSNFAKEKNLSKSVFAKKLLGQIVFCYFLQKKGWLGVEKNKKFGDGDKSFIRNKFNQYNKGEENFYNNFLEYFFYEGLNNENENDFVKKINCRVPYIGGGLFEYYEGYDWRKEKLNIPNKTFSNKDKTGILDIFDLYNFTVDENEDLDLEISIDPEMLGRVFENLLEENLRKEGGSYYTPRTIVSYMCENSLINFLNKKLNNNISYEQIENFVKNKYFDISEEKILIKKADEIDNILTSIKICDPAIGSGAFAVGFINLISRLRVSLKDVVKRKYKNNSYYFKRDCIENSIYGVDVDNSAVEIAKLRLWLSLIVEKKDYDKSEPLPNLDLHLIQGNSLINKVDGFNFQHLDIKDKDYQFQLLPSDVWEEFSKAKKEFINLKNKYFNIKSYNNKKNVRKQIENLLIKITQLAFSLDGGLNKIKNVNYQVFNKIRSDKNFFLWKLYFIEIFQDNPGFDIVIGNPPYIGEKGNSFKFQEVKNASNLSKFYQRKMDYYYFFFHLGLDILKKDGVLSFITTSYFTTATAGKNLRKDLKTRSSFSELIDFNELKIFKSAQGQHNIITTLIKNVDNNLCKTIKTLREGYASQELLKNILYFKDEKTSYKTINSKNIFEGSDDYIRLEGNILSGNSIENKILNKIVEGSSQLSNLCNINQGLLTGVDKVKKNHQLVDSKISKYIDSGVYVLEQNEIENLSLKKHEKKVLKKFYKNSNINKFYCDEHINTNQKYVLYLTRDLDLDIYPNIKKHLYKFRKIIENRSEERGEMQAALKLGKWWVIFAARKKKLFEEEKIVCPQRSPINTFAYSESEFYASADVYFISNREKKINLKYILSILNSKLFFFWLKKKGKTKGNLLELLYKPLCEIPFKIFNKIEQDKLITIINKILEIKKINNEVKNLEKQMNQIIYKNYNLSSDEIEFIENFYPKNN